MPAWSRTPESNRTLPLTRQDSRHCELERHAELCRPENVQYWPSYTAGTGSLSNTVEQFRMGTSIGGVPCGTLRTKVHTCPVLLGDDPMKDHTPHSPRTPFLMGLGGGSGDSPVRNTLHKRLRDTRWTELSSGDDAPSCISACIHSSLFPSL